MSDEALDERRKVAGLLRELICQVVTADTDDASFALIADALIPLRDRLAREKRLEVEVGGLHTREHAAVRFGRVPVYDRDPMIGLSNPLAPPLRRVEGGGPADWEVTFGDAYGGHPGFVHGGYVAAVIDHVLGVTASSAGFATMTGSLTTRYRLPTPLHTRLLCRGEVSHVEGRKVFCRGTLETDGALIAEAEGVYIRVDPDRY